MNFQKNSWQWSEKPPPRKVFKAHFKHMFKQVKIIFFKKNVKWGFCYFWSHLVQFLNYSRKEKG